MIGYSSAMTFVLRSPATPESPNGEPKLDMPSNVFMHLFSSGCSQRGLRGNLKRVALTAEERRNNERWTLKGNCGNHVRRLRRQSRGQRPSRAKATARDGGAFRPTADSDLHPAVCDDLGIARKRGSNGCSEMALLSKAGRRLSRQRKTYKSFL